MTEFKWEKVEHNHGNALHRAPVFGGWLVMSTDSVLTVLPTEYSGRIRNDDGHEWRTSICFIPDPNHEWDLTKDYGNT